MMKILNITITLEFSYPNWTYRDEQARKLEVANYNLIYESEQCFQDENYFLRDT